MYTTEHLSAFGSQQQKVLLFRYKQLAVTLLYTFFNLYLASLLRHSKTMALKLVYGMTIGRPTLFLQAPQLESASRSPKEHSRPSSGSRLSTGVESSSPRLFAGQHPLEHSSAVEFSRQLSRQLSEKCEGFQERKALSIPSCQNETCLLACEQKAVDDLTSCAPSNGTTSDQPPASTIVDHCSPVDPNVPADLSALPSAQCEVAEAASITPSELVDLGCSEELVLILDCRAFTAYNANHVMGALNVACSDRITKKRLSDGKIGLVDVISGQEGKERYRELEGKAKIVIYDEGTMKCEGLPGSHPLIVIGECLKKEGKRSRYLLGGLQAFLTSHPDLCTDSGVPLLFSPTAPEQNVAIDSAEASEILPYLFIGNYRDASNRDRLTELGITHVVNVTASLPLYFETEGIQYKRLPASDSGSQNLSQYFSEAIEFIERARAADGRVLVHCQAGVSRSPSIVLAYLIARSQRSLNDAFTHVKERRSIVAPNLNFMGQLLAFEQQQQLLAFEHQQEQL